MNLVELSETMNEGVEEPVMPLLAIEGVAAGHIFCVPIKANFIELHKPVGFKPIVNRFRQPEIKYEEIDEYEVHRFDAEEDSEGITFALGILKGTRMEDAISIVFSAYCDQLVAPPQPVN